MSTRKVLFGSCRVGFMACAITACIPACAKTASPVQTRGASETVPAIADHDRDGLEDALERRLGTDSQSADTDGDGLDDYQEHCKYLTDPTRKDSDGDGILDGNWLERREYTYTVRAICRIRPPVTVKGMNDLYQDARFLKKAGTPEDASIVEVLIFPFATPHVVGRQRLQQPVPESLRDYVRPTVAMNFSPEMQKAVRRLIGKTATRVEAVEKILRWISSETTLVRANPHWDYFNIVNNKISWHRRLAKQEERRFLETTFYGESMFKRRVHGTCSSQAILTASMIRALGIPSRLIQTFPLMGRSEKDAEPLADRLRLRDVAKGVQWPPGANHMYNEVFLNHRWIRADDHVNTGPFVGKTLFVRCYSLANWNNMIPFRSKKESLHEGRQFRALDVSDQYPVFNSRTTVDLAVTNDGLRLMNLDGQRKAVITIRNKGNWRSPRCDVYFYAGDPSKGGRLMGRNRAGPIMPGAIWNESHSLKLLNGESTVFVVIDPKNSLLETDETNNRASMMIPRANSR